MENCSSRARLCFIGSLVRISTGRLLHQYQRPRGDAYGRRRSIGPEPSERNLSQYCSPSEAYGNYLPSWRWEMDPSMIVDSEWRDETMKVVIQNGGIVRMSKGIPDRLADAGIAPSTSPLTQSKKNQACQKPSSAFGPTSTPYLRPARRF